MNTVVLVYKGKSKENYYEIHFTRNDYVGTLFEWEGFLYQ